MDWLDILPHLGAALAVGLMIGLERGWKLRGAVEGQRVAGIRTFTLLALSAGIAGVLASLGYEIVSGVVVAGAAAIVAMGYSRSVADNGRPDATSAVAAMLTLGLGFLAGLGQGALAVAGGAVVTLVLALRTEMHRFVGAMDEADIKAFARYAVIALAVFPFLPEGRFGPYDA
ncbi:MAG: MgtC/SapB family protein, partial [Erythrobacter sp.]|nr:MgtC/SapB family protein [Erythrobacter sp.]